MSIKKLRSSVIPHEEYQRKTRSNCRKNNWIIG